MLPRRLSEPGPVLDYLRVLFSAEATRTIAKDTVRDVIKVLDSPEGRTLLELLEKSTLETSLPITGDVRALEARNAQSFIALDLRRILSNELDAALADKKSGTGTGRRRGNSDG